MTTAYFSLHAISLRKFLKSSIMPIIIEKLSKRSGREWVFRDVDLEVREGEVFGIFGPNNAGKNTMLQMIAGNAEANGGTINGAKKVTYLDTNAPAPGSLLGGLFGKRSNGTSSGRQTQIEQAIETCQGILLLNEPFAGLDSIAKSSLIEKILGAVRERNLTAIIATADFDTVLQTCDRAAVLSDGYVRQTGTPQELYDAPEMRAVAALTGRSNLFEARRLTSSKSDMPEFQTIDGEHRLFTQKAELDVLGAINKNATLAIRPEQISISFGASFPEDNLIKAVITGTRFLGSTTVIELDCGGLKLEALVFRVVGLNVGDECMVGLPPDRIRVLKD